MLKSFLKALAWFSLIVIAIATLGPMTMRPETSAGPAFERLLAFAVCGFLLAAAYPRRLWVVALFLVAAAIGLESLQLIIPGRHGHLSDLVIKIGGGLSGVWSTAVCMAIWRGKTAHPVDNTDTSTFHAASPPVEE